MPGMKWEYLSSKISLIAVVAISLPACLRENEEQGSKATGGVFDVFEELRRIEVRSEKLVENDQFSGALLVARHNKILFQKAWGFADREAGKNNTVLTQFRLGSMNKMFTAIATLQLVESSKLALDDPIGKYLQDYANQDVRSKVTIRHLLTHTGGTGDIFGPNFRRNRLRLREHSDYIKLYGHRDLLHEPGAEVRYSNYGYVLLGALVEEASGISYYEYLKRNIFQPAGMTSTDSLPESESVSHRSVGYMEHNGTWRSNAETLPWRGTAAGGGYSTIGDLFLFAEALESEKLIPEKVLSEATKAQSRRSGQRSMRRGYGFALQGEGLGRRYGHGGGAPGMNGVLYIYPEIGYVVICLSNFDPPAASRLVRPFVQSLQEASDLE